MNAIQRHLLRYGLDAGRILTIDGLPMMVFVKAMASNAPALATSDADILAHRIVNALNDMELRRVRLMDAKGD
jgi:hypothetical protein